MPRLAAHYDRIYIHAFIVSFVSIWRFPSFLSSPGEVRSLWAQLRRDEPHLLSNFEEFLARVTHQIKEAHQEKKEMESALQR